MHPKEGNGMTVREQTAGGKGGNKGGKGEGAALFVGLHLQRKIIKGRRRRTDCEG